MRQAKLHHCLHRPGLAAMFPRFLTLAAACVLAVLLSSRDGLSQTTDAGSSPATAAQTPPSVPASRAAGRVAVITIGREIDMILARSVERRIREAEAGGADAIVFELDTPGGDLYAMIAICSAIKRSKVPNTVAWVNSKAYSAGAIIALACREIVISDNATIGDAAPIQVAFGMLNQLKETERQKILGPALTEVVDSARTRGYDERLVQAFVSRGVDLWLVENTQTGQQVFVGKDEYKLIMGEDPPFGTPRVPAASGAIPLRKQLAQERGTPSPRPVSESAKQPPDGQTTGAVPADGRAPAPVGGQIDHPYTPAIPGLPEDVVRDVSMNQRAPTQRPAFSGADKGKWRLLEFVSDGNGLLTLRNAELLRYGLATSEVKDETQLRAIFGRPEIVRLDESWSEQLVAPLDNLIVKGVLLVIFLIALFVEMTHPGAILPGCIAATALVGLVAPAMFADLATWWTVPTILIGIGLIALEIFVIPGFGITGVIGLLALFAGLLGTFTASEGLFPDTARGQSELLHGVTTLVLSTVCAGIGIYALAKHLPSLPIVRRLVLADQFSRTDDASDEGLLAAMETEGPIAVGVIGRAITPLRPAGRVEIGDQIVDVVADIGFIPSGAMVRVVSTGEFRVTVEIVDGGRAPNPSKAGGAPESGGVV